MRNHGQPAQASELRIARAMLSFFMAGPELVRWDLTADDGGHYSLTVRHATGVIVEHYTSAAAALLREQELEKLLQAARGFVPPAKPATEKPCILIVDDEPELLIVCSRALEPIGCQTQVAVSAEAAMELVEAAPPDAIMIDLKMPYINGLGFLYRVRETHPHLPVAIITAASNLDDATLREISALEADLRFKPLPIGEIQMVARGLLARRHRV
jgi:CheY-like chemotaxis protein